MALSERDAAIVERLRLGWTQGETAEHFHLTQGTVSKIARKAGLTMRPALRRPLIAADLVAGFAEVRARVAAKYNASPAYIDGIERQVLRR